MSRQYPRLFPIIVVASIVPALFGCRGRTREAATTSPALPGEQVVAPGVVFRTLSEGPATAYLLDVDLLAPGIRVWVASGATHLRGNRLFADARTVHEWCERTGALAGINGGFFGDRDGGGKQVIGLLAQDGEVLSSGRLVRSPSHRDQRFARCVLGFDSGSVPHVGWAVGERGRAALLTEFDEPLNPRTQQYWDTRSAVACGPRLIHAGRIRVTDREERLVSPPPLSRTFVGYSLESGRPRYLALAVGWPLTFLDAARLLRSYFGSQHGTECAEAMCLDGGSSSQLTFKGTGGLVDARPTPVSVPTAVLIGSDAASQNPPAR